MARVDLVSIVVPALNAERFVGRCLEAIMNVRRTGADLEVILMDNGSTDRTCEIAKQFGVRVFVKTGINISALRNWGAREAKGDIVGFVDADNIIPASWLEDSLEYFDRPRVAMVGSRYRQLGANWIANAWAVLHEASMIFGEADWLPGGNMIVRREPFEEVGGFDENLVVSEDYELCSRLRGRRFVILSDPRLASLHLGVPKNLWELYKKELWRGREMVHVYLKSGTRLRDHPSLVLALFMGFCVICVFGGIVIGFPCKGFCLSLPGLSAVFLCSILLALRTVSRVGKYRYLPSVTILFLVYGFARMVCLIDRRNWFFIKAWISGDLQRTRN